MKTISNLTLILLFLVFFSCQRDSGTMDTPTPDTKALSIDNIKEIATMHNEALGYMENGLNTQAVTTQNYKGAVSDGLTPYFNQKFEASAQVTLAQRYTQKALDRFDAFREAAPQLAAYFSLSNVIETNKSLLTDMQIEFLQQIQAALSETSSYEEIVAQLNTIGEQAEKELSAEEAVPILAGVEVGKSSLQYWKDNLATWIELLAPNQEGAPTAKAEEGGWFDWVSIAEADIAGAVLGSIYSTYIEESDLPEGLTTETIIFSMATATSAASAIIQILEHQE